MAKKKNTLLIDMETGSLQGEPVIYVHPTPKFPSFEELMKSGCLKTGELSVIMSPIGKRSNLSCDMVFEMPVPTLIRTKYTGPNTVKLTKNTVTKKD